jgi:hypothetical protein
MVARPPACRVRDFRHAHRPVGFALKYDPIGRFRSKDPAGRGRRELELKDGTRFEGLRARAWLLRSGGRT